MGRRKGGRNKGYYYRKDRGWYTSDGIPLEYPDGRRMRDRNTPQADIKAAYNRLIVNGRPTVNGTTILEVCTAYLAKAKDENTDKTFTDRADTLYDFCLGYPPRFRKSEAKPTKEDRIHKGYGGLVVNQLKPLHIDQWLQAHPTWNGGRRSRVQAVLRALNYGDESGLIDDNPIKGYKQPKQNARVTYITPEQEQALLEHATDAFKVALQVCIRTGARPGCEFAALESRHVTDHGERMEWTFPADESKTGKLRVIRITDPEIIELVRGGHSKGRVFRNTRHDPWTEKNLSLNFRRTKTRTGIEFDKDACMYSCRHTYAKRTLQGYWTGKQTNIETLARLMGNSPQVCRDHYLQWADLYNEPLWESA